MLMYCFCMLQPRLVGTNSFQLITSVCPAGYVLSSIAGRLTCSCDTNNLKIIDCDQESKNIVLKVNIVCPNWELTDQ